MAAAALKAAADRYDVSTAVELDASRGLPVLAEEDDETLACTCDAVALHFGDIAGGPGKLFITTRRVIWCGAAEGERGLLITLALSYPQIVMHAVSKDGSAFPRPCIYLQLDDGSEDMMTAGEDEEEEEEEVEPQQGASITGPAADQASPELRLVPDDSAQVEELFNALCSCAALNPDPENEDEGDFFFDEAEVMAGLDDATRAQLIAQRIEGGAMALHGPGELEQLVGEDPGRFEDEEEDEGEMEGEEPSGAASRPATNGHGH